MEDGKVKKIIYEDNHLLVVEKPVNILVQGDNTKDLDLQTELKTYLKNKYSKPGNVYLGIVQRLDRPTGGVMVFAKTSKAAGRLSNQLKNKTMFKTYLAIVEGNISKKGEFIDYLSRNEDTNTTYVDKNGKYAKLTYEKIAYKDNLSLVKINLETGRHHQIRVQFSFHGYPLYGDQRYNKNALKNTQLALWSYKLVLVHPTTKEEKVFISIPNVNNYPWNLFRKEIEDGKI